MFISFYILVKSRNPASAGKGIDMNFKVTLGGFVIAACN